MTAVLAALLRRLKIMTIMAVVVCTLAGCPGPGPSPTPYNCGQVNNRDHCWTQLYIGFNPALRGIRGFQTKVSVVSMNPGDGFITDEFWLSGSNCTCWIETGYIADQTGQYYYWGQQAPGSYFAFTPLGPVTAADLGQWATLAIQQISPQSYSIDLVTPTHSYVVTVNNSYLSDPNALAYVQVGQELAGTMGATAYYAFFEYNKLFTGGSWSYITGGSVKQDAPPYGGWLGTPSLSDPGGVFLTQCCSPPSSTSSASAAPVPSPVPKPPPAPPPSARIRLPVGVPALRVTSPGHMPAFTAAEAEAYAIAHTPGTTAVNGKRVAQTTFMTAAHLRITLRGAAAGLPADTTVCYVVLNGRFTVEAPPRPGQKATTLHFSHAFMVFDARTGTLLMKGDLPA